MRLILGSQSKGRREVMERMGMSFTVMPADIDEKLIRNDDPVELTRAIAHAKADALLVRIQEPVILITADTVVTCNGKIREKAMTSREAGDFLREYGMYPLQTVSAVVVTNTHTRVQKDGVDIVSVWFRPIPEDVIAQMVARDDICSFAGAFAFQDPLQKSFIDRIKGEEESILGLPKALTLWLLAEIGG
jgi:septum formation protein